MRSGLPVHSYRPRHNSGIREKSDEKIELLKYVGVAMTLLGILAWVAGRAFISGYWNAANLPTPPSMSVQEVAFEGFVGPVWNWMVAIPALVFMGLYVAFLGVGRKISKKRHVRGRFVAWCHDNFQYDRTIGKVGALIIIAALCLFFIVLPLFFWTASAYVQGKDKFKKDFCGYSTARATALIGVVGGGQIKGDLLDASNKHLVVLNEQGVSIVDGETFRLVLSLFPSKELCMKK